MNPVYPLLFKPVYQNYIWGGDRIPRTFNRKLPDGIYAESWEVSDRPEGMSVIENGALAGQSLAEVIQREPETYVGAVGDGHRFPLLIKLIDARETLSVQVHPNDESAELCGGEAKTEMWYVLAADDGACVYAGLKPTVSEKVFREAVEHNSLGELLNVLPVKAGDAIFMPGGRVHAIGAGCLLLEVQQNSNTTYRIYDWGRVGADGQPRPLHLEQALSVMEWSDATPSRVEPRLLGHMEQNELREILACPLFRMERLTLKEAWPTAHDGLSFQVLFVQKGAVSVCTDTDEVKLQAGTCCMIPAALTAYSIDVEEAAEVLRITVPQ